MNRCHIAVFFLCLLSVGAAHADFIAVDGTTDEIVGPVCALLAGNG